MKTYAIARISNKFNPREDRVSFLAQATTEYGPDMWRDADDACLFTAAELAAIIPGLDELARSNYVGNGECSPDDILLIPAGTAQLIARRSDDMSLYDWDDYEGGDDVEAQGDYCNAQDIARVRADAIASHGFASAILRDVEGACEERNPNEAERAALDRAGYGHNWVADARVIAETGNGARLYRMDADEYCIEGETGEMVAELSGADAIRQWC